MNSFVFKNFWGVSASALGTYEMVSFLSRQKLPTISTFCSRTRRRRALMVLWTIGLAQHVWRHQP